MRTEVAPKTKLLKDYRPYGYAVKSLELDFDLHPGKTTVSAKTHYLRQRPEERDLLLYGEDIKLVSITVNGARPSYEAVPEGLLIRNLPDEFLLECVTEFSPEENTALEGLYRSGSIYCTQCEPEGFRKITYYPDRPDIMTTYKTRIEADKKDYPILLSNGNLTENGDLDKSRHYAVWEDPFPKPSYLFALVAGDLACVKDHFITASGRKVDLFIYVDHGNEDKCAHAMDSLKRSMKWDEERYGREYDLDLFNIVAVNDFNYGAMENKSLNIFNARYVLASPKTATDAAFMGVESVIAHEYFHNWTGNRITCRDWFQLSLKEGLTVFRDQSFSADMNDPDVQRIDGITGLRAAQFPEDSSPLAHPIRPESYIEINNFYTSTVYEKGAEIIRMLHTILGPENYRKATDLYFNRHDGQAVTCDDFLQCMEDSSGIDLSVFRRWYSQAGTPVLNAKTSYDAQAKTYTVTLSQETPPTPGQDVKLPVHIPVAIGLLGQNGQDLLPEGTRVLHLTEKEQSFTFENIAQAPVPSILRGFSAPVKLETDLQDQDLLFLMAHDSDGFNRWDSGQIYLSRFLLKMAATREESVPEELVEAFKIILQDENAHPALIAKALSLPSQAYLAQKMDEVDVEGLYFAVTTLYKHLGERLGAEFLQTYQRCNDQGPYQITPEAMGKRLLKNTALGYLVATRSDQALKLTVQQFDQASNMTDQSTALSYLTFLGGAESERALDAFYQQWKHDPLVLDQWFTIQARADRQDAPEQVRRLYQHPDFTLKNPNRVRSLISAFASANQRWFHRADGAGYEFLADSLIELDAINPHVAARNMLPFREWRRYDQNRKDLMQAQIQRLLQTKNISKNLYEIASKSLKA